MYEHSRDIMMAHQPLVTAYDSSYWQPREHGWCYFWAKDDGFVVLLTVGMELIEASGVVHTVTAQFALLYCENRVQKRECLLSKIKANYVQMIVIIRYLWGNCVFVY